MRVLETPTSNLLHDTPADESFNGGKFGFDDIQGYGVTIIDDMLNVVQTEFEHPDTATHRDCQLYFAFTCAIDGQCLRWDLQSLGTGWGIWTWICVDTWKL